MNESVADTRKEPITCPRCEHALTEAEICSILGRLPEPSDSARWAAAGSAK